MISHTHTLTSSTILSTFKLQSSEKTISFTIYFAMENKGRKRNEKLLHEENTTQYFHSHYHFLFAKASGGSTLSCQL
jgi:hypothetical protein